MRPITLKELFEGSLLSIPETAETLDLVQLEQGERFKAAGGVYTFYSNFNEPLYVGISDNVRTRVLKHLRKGTGNPDLFHYINSGRRVYVKVFYEESKVYQEVYESYLIQKLAPRFNVAKTGRVKL